MADAWLGPTCQEQTLAFGPLALVVPMLQRLGVADRIDAHLPPDPQLRHSHGRVLSLLLAARLCQPTALVNISTWAEHSGADLLWNIPAEDLNDDRLGRALDAFFEQRHAIQAVVAAETLRLAVRDYASAARSSRDIKTFKKPSIAGRLGARPAHREIYFIGTRAIRSPR